jgi:serine phosphatase RsbU (regulator of sigma subunit)
MFKVAARGFALMARSSPRGQHKLTIQQIFLLLACLNGVVLASLLLSAWQLLHDQTSGVQHAATTIFLALLLVVGLGISYRIVAVRVIRPLSRLVYQSDNLAFDYSRDRALLDVQGNDEIARLAHAFNGVLYRQRQAIEELDAANKRLRDMNQQIDDSIRYAALLQKSILPDRQLSERFGDDYFVLWQPRDIVGGDYYVFHGDDQRCIVGVADCAGHGVSGAMMTMLARAGLDRSIQQVGMESPAQVLQATNSAIHGVLGEAQITKAMATSMDAGLVFLDLERRILRFAGARISLYWSDGRSVSVARADNRPLWDRRAGTYNDQVIPLASDYTYYLATDGILDQSGGEDGFGLGADRFERWLLDHATKPLDQQHQAFRDSLAAFMGAHPQRDDITIFSFRVSSVFPDH